MKFTLIICTYMRPVPLLNLLNSVKEQTLFPNEILIIENTKKRNNDELLNTCNISDNHYQTCN
jgi:GT2 family glycosyltransferase